jgi:hypothetical protein
MVYASGTDEERWTDVGESEEQWYARLVAWEAADAAALAQGDLRVGFDTLGRRYRQEVKADGSPGWSWYVTDCCSAPATITEGEMNCKSCYESCQEWMGGIPQIGPPA